MTANLHEFFKGIGHHRAFTGLQNNHKSSGNKTVFLVCSQYTCLPLARAHQLLTGEESVLVHSFHNSRTYNRVCESCTRITASILQGTNVKHNARKIPNSCYATEVCLGFTDQKKTVIRSFLPNLSEGARIKSKT